MKVLVTGATGFIASHLLPLLSVQDHEVFAVGHDRSRIPDLAGVEPFEVDLSQALPRALPAADAVVHLAQANVAFPDGARALFAVNTASTAALLEYARDCGASRFVFTSSASVYGLGDTQFGEDAPTTATDFYSATKLAAERLVLAYGTVFSTTIMRLVAPYGPGQTRRLIPSLVQRVRDARPVTLNEGGRPRMNPIYVDDVVRIIERALASEESQLVNVSGDESAGIDQLARLIGDALGAEPVFEQGPGAAGDLIARNDRMKQAFGVDRLVPLREGLQRVVEVPA